MCQKMQNRYGKEGGLMSNSEPKGLDTDESNGVSEDYAVVSCSAVSYTHLDVYKRQL